jgi:hypothetical protein
MIFVMGLYCLDLNVFCIYFPPLAISKAAVVV